MLDIEAQELLLVALYNMDNENPGCAFSLNEVCKAANLESLILRIQQSVVFQLQNKGYLQIVSSGPRVMITPSGREAAERIILEKRRSK